MHDANMGIWTPPYRTERGSENVQTYVGGTGSASTLPMSDDECKAAAEAKQPVGFVAPASKKDRS